MQIRLKCGLGNFLFEHRRNRYLLESNPVVFQPTLGEFARDRVDRTFVYGRVSLMVLASGPSRIKREYRVSSTFYGKEEYGKAVVSGFEVERGASSAARLLLKVGLADLVLAEGS